VPILHFSSLIPLGGLFEGFIDVADKKSAAAAAAAVAAATAGGGDGGDGSGINDKNKKWQWSSAVLPSTFNATAPAHRRFEKRAHFLDALDAHVTMRIATTRQQAAYFLASGARDLQHFKAIALLKERECNQTLLNGVMHFNMPLETGRQECMLEPWYIDCFRLAHVQTDAELASAAASDAFRSSTEELFALSDHVDLHAHDRSQAWTPPPPLSLLNQLLAYSHLVRDIDAHVAAVSGKLCTTD
jgi:hypothetical protein